MSRRAKNRIAQLLKHAPTEGLRIEVAPYHSPILPKRDGHQVLTLDVFDTATLRRLAAEDPNITPGGEEQIEEVDLVGDASDLAGVLARAGITQPVSLILSSHNFEHLPDPIRFLRGTEEVLAPGGMLSMALPDCRVTFDHFRMPVRLADWLLAWHQQRKRPGPETVFDAKANIATLGKPGAPITSGSWQRSSPGDYTLWGGLQDSYDQWLADEAATDPPYRDSHVSPLFGTVFELLIADLQTLGLVGLEVVEISETEAHEFFVHLRKPLIQGAKPPALSIEARTELSRRVMAEMGARAFPSHRLRWTSPKLLFRSLVTRLFGKDSLQRLSAWNRQRKAGRR